MNKIGLEDFMSSELRIIILLKHIVITIKHKPMKTGKTSLIALLLLISATAFSQAEVITWQSQNIKNLRNGEDTAYVCSFRIYPNEKIEWIQGGGELDSDFQISSTEGALPTKGNGQVIYHITKEGYDGTITIKRTKPNEVILTLDLSTISSLSAYYQFTVISQ